MAPKVCRRFSKAKAMQRPRRQKVEGGKDAYQLRLGNAITGFSHESQKPCPPRQGNPKIAVAGEGGHFAP